jgi:OOP family OmpA-OmpF porin
MKAPIVAALLAGLTLASAPAFADDHAAGFFRIEAGRTDIKVEGESENDTSYGVRGGYNFNRNFGIEGFYTRYGQESAYIDFVEATARVKAQGYGIGVFGKTNFGGEAYTGFFVSGRVGIARNELDVGVDGVGSVDDTDTNPYFGVGVGYDFNRKFGVSLNYDYQEPKVFDTRFKLETFTLGLEFRF